MKRGVVLLVFASIIFSGFVSAGFWDFLPWNGDSNIITGEVVEGESQENLVDDFRFIYGSESVLEAVVAGNLADHLNPSKGTYNLNLGEIIAVWPDGSVTSVGSHNFSTVPNTFELVYIDEDSVQLIISGETTDVISEFETYEYGLSFYGAFISIDEVDLENQMVTFTTGRNEEITLFHENDDLSPISDNNLILVGISNGTLASNNAGCSNKIIPMVFGKEICDESILYEELNIGFAGEWIIKSVESPFSSEKFALIVAGHSSNNLVEAESYFEEHFSSGVSQEDLESGILIKSGSIELGESCSEIGLEIVQVNCGGESSEVCNVSVSRDAVGDDIGGIKLIFTDEENMESFIHDVSGNIGPLALVTESNVNTGLTHLNTVEVAPYFVNSAGTENLCSIKDLFEINEDSVAVGGKTVILDFIDSNGNVRLVVDGEVTNVLKESEEYMLNDGSSIVIEDVDFSIPEVEFFIKYPSRIGFGEISHEQTVLEWRDSNYNEISESDVVVGQSELVLYFKDPRYTGDEIVNFYIWEDRFIDEQILGLPSNSRITSDDGSPSEFLLILPIEQYIADSIQNNPSNLYFTTDLGVGKSDSLTLNMIEEEVDGAPEEIPEVIDTTPPRIVSGVAGGLPGVGAKISVSTDEEATCRYSTSDIIYSEMTTFFETGGFNHEQDLTLPDGQSYDYYVRCMDSSGNVNVDSREISFSIAESPSTEAVPLPKPTPSCQGCEINGQCYPVGHVEGDQYCSSTLGFIDQRPSGSVCSNNYECANNLCESRQCSSPPIQNRIADFFGGFFQQN